ncbi:hypothetical protein QR77_15805 [Streptomyces sp. 150FB]|uniref:hypothetical protein n=1 Tax=Streptomyces sp. 150FB TaxID=1576605 RepID=UPI000588F2ED|nr:hypothetical protein [Streptomyces sp. 150FB]KIF78869.1 hypothetical protein QR77_15805 [Streptomyces sp. 150FB]
MSYLRGFIPWIVFAVAGSWDWRWAAVAALLTGAALLLQDRRAGIPADAQVLEVSTVVYFAGLAVLAFAFPQSPLKTYDDVASFGWLALTAWGSLAGGRPFTLGIARRRTPPEYWERPEFLRINAIITAAWASSFTLLGLALAVCVLTGAPVWLTIACHVVGLAAPMVFTARYPARVQARLAAVAGSASASPSGPVSASA